MPSVRLDGDVVEELDGRARVMAGAVWTRRRCYEIGARVPGLDALAAAHGRFALTQRTRASPHRARSGVCHSTADARRAAPAPWARHAGDAPGVPRAAHASRHWLACERLVQRRARSHRALLRARAWIRSRLALASARRASTPRAPDRASCKRRLARAAGVEVGAGPQSSVSQASDASRRPPRTAASRSWGRSASVRAGGARAGASSSPRCQRPSATSSPVP